MLLTEDRTPRRGLFAILFPGRTGSTYLMSLLNQHRNILCYPEILSNQNAEQEASLLQGMARGEHIEKLCGHRRIWPSCRLHMSRYPLYEIYARFRTLDYVGLKTKHNSISDLDGFRSFANRTNMKIIMLSRRDPVATAVSVMNARRMNEKYKVSNARSQKMVQGPMHLDVDMFDRVLVNRGRQTQRIADYVSTFNTPVLACHYEELRLDRDAFLVRLFDFLDLPFRRVDYKHSIHKNTTRSLAETIENYEEVCARYRGTEYEQFFPA